MTRSLNLALAAAVFAAVPSAVFAQELLVNPGFEDLDGVPGADGQPTYGDGWGSFGAASFNNFFGSAESPNGHASLFADMNGNFGGVFQQGITGTAGTTYTFSLTDTLVEAAGQRQLPLRRRVLRRDGRPDAPVDGNRADRPVGPERQSRRWADLYD